MVGWSCGKRMTDVIVTCPFSFFVLFVFFLSRPPVRPRVPDAKSLQPRPSIRTPQTLYCIHNYKNRSRRERNWTDGWVCAMRKRRKKKQQEKLSTLSHFLNLTPFFYFKSLAGIFSSGTKQNSRGNAPPPAFHIYILYVILCVPVTLVFSPLFFCANRNLIETKSNRWKLLIIAA